ncbi:MAG: FG-GAP-like repeat-containing protein [Bacteroidales bacterium]|nr:T9SS type A sorting domain-containing protein [Lentimicrobiaceae bacterium]MDD5695475.1 FG-GAP-like repeat-containing protein [Bacteroidales bacterium]
MKRDLIILLLWILFWTLVPGIRLIAQGSAVMGQGSRVGYEDFGFRKDFSIPVRNELDQAFLQPWVGGLNACQISEVDLDLDGIMDLVVFDRHGNRLLPFINHGNYLRSDYTYAPEYQSRFPAVREWMNLADYDGDGRNDLFTYTTGGIRVYRNASDTLLTFNLEIPMLYSYYYTGQVNLFALPDDYPAFTDVDGDGDMDILNFFTLGKYLNFHRNLSVEKYGIPDSLDFRLAELCWGHFEENELSNVLSLNIDCENRLPYDASERHAGSTLLALDMDGDQDKDLLVGDIDYATIIGLTNGGTCDSAYMTHQDTMFPSNTIGIDLMSMPVCTYIDVNHDGTRDLLTSPFDPGLDRTENSNSVWLYENLGTNDAPVFHFKQNDFLQEEMIDLGAGAYPVVCDVNQDGLQDLVVGNFGYLDTAYYQLGYLYLTYRSQLALFLNTGEEGLPSFRLADKDFGHLSSLMLTGAYPALADLDDDGDMDLLAGNSDGILIYLENLAGPGQMPVFADPVMNFQGIDVGEYSAPQLIDLDRDGLTDLVMGKSDGTLSYYRNTGSKSHAVFTLVTDLLGGVDVTDTTLSLDGFSTPCFFESEGEYRLFAGSEFGHVYYYRDIEANLAGSFTQVSDHYLFIDEGSRTGLAVWNFNNDEFPDMLIGNYSGGLALYKGVTPSPLHTGELQEILPGLRLYPNPAGDILFIAFSGSMHAEPCGIHIIDLLGREMETFRIDAKGVQTLNVSRLPQGVYLVIARCEKSAFGALRFIKY